MARSRRGFQTAVAVAALALLVSFLPARAATPSSGTVGPANGSQLSWDFAAVGPGVSVGGTPADIERECLPQYCDPFELTVALPQPDGDFYSAYTATLTITYTWTSPVNTDMDVFAFAPDGTESGPGSPDDSNAGDGHEILTIQNPPSGTWVVESHVGITPAPTAAHAVVQLTYTPRTLVTPPSPGAHDPYFQDMSPPAHYQSADVLGRTNAGEPSLGTDWKTGAALYMAGTQVSRVTFNDTTHTASWTDVTPPQQSLANEDAILVTDHTTGHTVAEGLLVAGANGSITDDDGATWQPAAFPVPHGPDHETVGIGPYASPTPATAGLTGFPKAVYYCSQDIVTAAGAFCGRSDTGGTAYNPSSPVFGATSPCGAIHGHVKVAPDGTVYVPQNQCARPDGVEGQGMAVSTDNGQTWTYSVVPDSTAKPINAGTDPSVGIGAGNTVYFAYEAGDGHARVAVSHDHGQTWSPSYDIGASWNIANSKFPAVVAGDDNRAAVAFLGTPSAGNDQSAAFHGTWYLFVAYTYDGGQTWQTVNATPGDPVQRGCIWNGGGSNACRNLLDFNDATIDQQGRVLVAYTDGCANIDYSYSSLAGGAQGAVHGPSQCDSNPDAFADTDKVSLDGLARQSCGRGLFAAYDPGFTAGCPAPRVIATNPANGATGVRTSTSVSATFDQAVNTWSLKVSDPLGNAVKGSATCMNPCVAPIFTPQARLKKATLYTATVTGTNGNGTVTVTWSFTTTT